MTEAHSEAAGGSGRNPKRGFRSFLPAVVMAPLAGITNGPFREIAALAGCRLGWTEMITAEGLVRRHPEILEALPQPREPHPVVVQLFGADPSSLAEAAAMAEAAGADAIDLNMACPVRRVTGVGAGAALMRDPPRAASLVREVCNRVRLPVTVKMRTGWDDRQRNALALALAVVEAGAEGVTIHGRTRAQGFAGRADHGLAAELVRELPVPVVVSGDIGEGRVARRVLEETGAAAVMIGRAALGNPWVFGTIERQLRGEPAAEPGDEERLPLILRHLDLLADRFGDYRAVQLFRPHLVGYLRGRNEAARWRRELLAERTAAGVRSGLRDCIRDSASGSSLPSG